MLGGIVASGVMAVDGDAAGTGFVFGGTVTDEVREGDRDATGSGFSFGGAAVASEIVVSDGDATGAGFVFGVTVTAIDANVGVVNFTVPGRRIAGGREGSCCRFKDVTRRGL